MVTCPKCREKNDEDSDYCEKCGAKLKRGNPKQELKSPIAACLLNLLIAGAGFAYLGKWGKAIGFFLLVIFSAIFFSFLGGLVMMIITMILCYIDAKKMNATEN
ncbi:MAG: zinc ribbon domain-containing protein [Candidatus Woesearchaeota archaeon]